MDFKSHAYIVMVGEPVEYDKAPSFQSRWSAAQWWINKDLVFPPSGKKAHLHNCSPGSAIKQAGMLVYTHTHTHMHTHMYMETS